MLHLPTGEVVTVLASGRENGGAAFEVDATLPPGLAGPPRHRHRFQTETFTVLDGRLRVRTGRETQVLTEGETVVVPPMVVHAFSNPFTRSARIRMVETPAGPLEDQFDALASSPGRPPLTRLAAINVEHDLSFHLAGIPDLVQHPMWQILAWFHARRRNVGTAE
jgi:quercetin dioxygenase-like cupin family protein